MDSRWYTCEHLSGRSVFRTVDRQRFAWSASCRRRMPHGRHDRQRWIHRDNALVLASCRQLAGVAVGEITELLLTAREGDPAALDQVFAAVYPTLRALAGSRLRAVGGESTLSPTVLVHETYLKLIGAAHLDLTDRHHFFACAARAMRQIAIDHARAHASLRRGGAAAMVDIDSISVASEPDHDLFDLDAALDQLDAIDSSLRELVEMRVFAGLTLEQLAETSSRSLRTVNRDWQRARALLMAQMAS